MSEAVCLVYSAPGKFDFLLDGIKTGHGRYLNEGRAIYINDIFLFPEYRGRGLGTQCFRFLLERIKEIAGGLPIYLQVEKDNTVAYKMYVRFGFEVHEKFEQDGKTIYRMFFGKAC